MIRTVRLTLNVGLEIAFGVAGIQLTRTGDLHTIAVHFVPVRNPAHGTRHGEDNGKHGGRNTHRFQDDTGLEVDVWIQFLLDVVLLVQRDML